MPDLKIEPAFEFRSITRGLLKQEVDFGDPGDAQWKVVSTREPSQEEWESPPGLPGKPASMLNQTRLSSHGAKPQLVLAEASLTGWTVSRLPWNVLENDLRGRSWLRTRSFPFPDSVEVAIQAGITAIVHPGGSIRDKRIHQSCKRSPNCHGDHRCPPFPALAFLPGGGCPCKNRTPCQTGLTGR